MNIDQLLKSSTFNIEPVIDVFLCDMAECRITLDVINSEISPNIGDLSFAAIVNFDLNIDDRKLLLEEIKKHVMQTSLNFVPYAETVLLEKFFETDSSLDQDLHLGHQEEFISPYPDEVNEELTLKIKEAFEKNLFEITYI